MSSNKELESINLDIEELKALESNHAKRDTVKLLLRQEIQRLELKRQNLQKNLVTEASNSAPDKAIYLTQVTNYAWDQSDKFVKIYLDLTDKKPIEESEINLSFQSRKSVILTFGKYKFSVKSLNKDVDTEGSYFKLTKTKIVLFLKKAKEGVTWSDLAEKLVDGSKKEKEEEKEDANAEDPSASLVKLMKKMYDEGDDDMKRTISKAWCEAQTKQAGGPNSTLDDLEMPKI